MKNAGRYFLIPLMALAPITLHAETLQQAMVKAYTTNPQLQAAQAKLRAVDEGVPLAKSGQRPSADFSAGVGSNFNNFNGAESNTTARDIGVTITQPIYRGGSIAAGIDSAEKNVLAARAGLHEAEQALFLTVAQAYFNVLRDQSVVKLTRKTEQVLTEEMKAAKDRFKVGEATRTDVAQAESRLSGANADRIQAEGNLAVSQATYERVVGNAPGELKDEKISLQLPATLDEAIALAVKNNPKVIAAQYTLESSEHEVDVAGGALLPQIDVQGSATNAWDQTPALAGSNESAKIMARITIPIYRSGADYAKTRAAKEVMSQRRVEVRDAMDGSRENAVRAWRQLATAKATITARKKQVEAAQLAYEGVKQESQVGTRTVLDRLDAEAEALQARVNQVQAERDQAVAMFDAKASVGELTAEKLGLPVTSYDPTRHYEKVKDSWIGTETDFTADTPAAQEEKAQEPAKEDTAAKPEEDGWFDNLLGMKW